MKPQFSTTKHRSYKSIVLLSLFGGFVLVVFSRGFSVKLDVDNEKDVSTASTISFHDFDSIKPRAYIPKDLPCYKVDDNWLDKNVLEKRARRGIFFVESSKTDATTGLSITLRITTNHPQNYCKVRFNHKKTSQMNYGHRRKQESLLWSLVREPTTRALLEFFHYKVAWKQTEPTLDNISAFFATPKRRNRQLKTLALTSSIKEGSEEETINTILQEFDFLGVTERMQESAVAIMMLLNLQISDVMYIPM